MVLRALQGEGTWGQVTDTKNDETAIRTRLYSETLFLSARIYFLAVISSDSVQIAFVRGRVLTTAESQQTIVAVYPCQQWSAPPLAEGLSDSCNYSAPCCSSWEPLRSDNLRNKITHTVWGPCQIRFNVAIELVKQNKNHLIETRILVIISSLLRCHINPSIPNDRRMAPAHFGNISFHLHFLLRFWSRIPKRSPLKLSAPPFSSKKRKVPKLYFKINAIDRHLIISSRKVQNVKLL